MTDPEIRKAMTVLARSFGNNFPRFCPLLCILYGSLSLILCVTGYETDYCKLYLMATVLLILSNKLWYSIQNEKEKEKDNPDTPNNRDPVNPEED